MQNFRRNMMPASWDHDAAQKHLMLAGKLRKGGCSGETYQKRKEERKY